MWSRKWESNLSFKITLPSSLSGSISVNLLRASLSLSRNLPGASFSSCSMFANLPYFKGLARACLSPSRIHLTKKKKKGYIWQNDSDPSSFICVVVPVWFCNWDCLIPSGEGSYLILPLPYWFITKPFISISNRFSQNSTLSRESAFVPRYTSHSSR